MHNRFLDPLRPATSWQQGTGITRCKYTAPVGLKSRNWRTNMHSSWLQFFRQDSVEQDDEDDDDDMA